MSDAPACPFGGCGNDELHETDDDPDHDWFCHWCGNLFAVEEDGLNAV